MKSWTLFGVCALAGAVVAMRRRAGEATAARELERCEGLLRRLDARQFGFR